MKVVLQKDVKDLGKVGEAVNVTAGYARNFLFPRKLAVEATENRIKEWEHLKKVAEIRKKKAVNDRKGLIEKVSGATVTFKAAAGETDKLFGSIVAKDISDELEKQGFSIDRRDIKVEAIKVLGQHQAVIDLGDDLKAEIVVIVERAD
ncbi:MAG: 50S ribosomal protein L9 [Pseudobdellovibrionaceae bacterium]|nr:50S ribosomal protein L9 [Bdellovibrionales bacterium]USN46823.1 MAG: 50S ribosomal protein L9 [Pseudobdellovibrionaceae bacterium]